MLLITPWWLDAVERRGRLAVDKEQMRRDLQIRCIVAATASSLLIIAVGFLAKNRPAAKRRNAVVRVGWRMFLEGGPRLPGRSGSLVRKFVCGVPACPWD